MKHIGTFKCTSNNIAYGDPAFSPCKQLEALNGVWHCYKTVLPSEKSKFGDERNKELIVIHNDFLHLKNKINNLENESCDVDSAAASVFAWPFELLYNVDTLFEENDCKEKRQHLLEEEYKKYNKTIQLDKVSEEPYCDLIELYHTLYHRDGVEYERVKTFGVIVWSGYGDGCYPVYTLKNANNEVYAIRISFIKENGDTDIHPKYQKNDCELI